MTGITLRRAQRADAALLQNLAQLYTHDFSEFWAGTSRGEVLADGRFADYPLDDYWARPGWSASLILCDAALAGFALVNDQPHSGRAVQASVAEFFVLRKHRGSGMGRRAAEMLFAARPGSWEIAIARSNLAAAAFWRRTLASLRPAMRVEAFDLHDHRWNGPILRFDWRGEGG